MKILPSNFNDIIVTLFEGHYHKGVAALINSLVASDFKGLINVGYTDQLPPWINQLKVVDEEYYSVSEEIFVRFETINVPMHLGYYKPGFMRKMFNDFPFAKRVYYFDPDIVIKASWDFFIDWVENGVALCLDSSFAFVHYNHPWRKQWKDLAQIDQTQFNNSSLYVNSGFVGVKHDNSILLDKWIDLTERYRLSGGNLKKFEKDGSRAFKGDQDLLNAAITINPDVALSIIGTEGMGFTFPAYLMTHAVGDLKPWQINFLKELLVRGYKPDDAQKNYFNYCKAPIHIFSNGFFFQMKLNLRIAVLLGRFIG
jgi:hypothetical protein